MANQDIMEFERIYNEVLEIAEDAEEVKRLTSEFLGCIDEPYRIPDIKTTTTFDALVGCQVIIRAAYNACENAIVEVYEHCNTPLTADIRHLVWKCYEMSGALVSPIMVYEGGEKAGEALKKYDTLAGDAAWWLINYRDKMKSSE
jgi:hypothetical protein